MTLCFAVQLHQEQVLPQSAEAPHPRTFRTILACDLMCAIPEFEKGVLLDEKHFNIHICCSSQRFRCDAVGCVPDKPRCISSG